MEFILKRLRGIAVNLLALLLATAGGCGDGRPARVPVSGQVLIDSKPLAYGQIQFLPKGARASRGTLDEQGRFTLTCFDNNDGAVPGEHAVVVSGSEQISNTKSIWHAPKKYTDASTSTITQQITGPTDSLVINLTWDGGQPFVEDENTGAIEPYRPEIHKPKK
jgi:hypothetical protein